MLASQWIDDAAPIFFLMDGLESAQRLTMAAFHTQAIVNLRGAAADKILLMPDGRVEQQVQVGGVHVAIAEYLVGRESGEGGAYGRFARAALAAQNRQFLHRATSWQIA